MLPRAEAIRSIFDEHGSGAIYVASTGYISRAVYELYPEWSNILYMQGSMGLAPAIGLGVALNSEQVVVVISGDASLLMHLGITHTIRDYALDNLFVYILDNGCHESVGAQPCSPLESSYPGVHRILRITRDGEPPRVGVSCEDNAKNVIAAIAASDVA